MTRVVLCAWCQKAIEPGEDYVAKMLRLTARNEDVRYHHACYRKTTFYRFEARAKSKRRAR